MSKRPRLTENKIIDKYLLIRTYKQFKRNPKKIFVCRDFHPGRPNKFRGKYLHTLVILDLIEELPTLYNTYNGGRKNIKGYRYKKMQDGVMVSTEDSCSSG